MDGEDLGLIDGSGTEEDVSLEGQETFTEDAGAPAGEDTEASETAEAERGDQRSEESDRRIGRTDLPLDVRRMLRANPEIAKQFPKLEKQLTGALFKANSVDQLGGVQKFREYAETLEAHGGPEGIAQLAEEIEDWRALDKGFEAGDPKVIDGWVQDYPEGFKALLGPAIEKLEAMSIGDHDRILSPAMWKTMDRCGVISTLQALESAISGNKIEDVAKEFKLLKGFFADLRSLAVKAKSPDPLASDRQRLNEEREGLATKENQMFYGGVRQEVNGQVMSAMNKLIRQELGGTTLKLAVANRLRKEINAELARVVNGNKPYQERYKAVMGTGDRDRAVRFIVGAARAKLPGVVKQLITEFNIRGTSPSGGRREGNGVRSGGGSSVVAGRPKTSEVDFNRTDKSVWLSTATNPGEPVRHGQAYLKNGKVAKW